ncbi:MAG: hypothetical protein Q7T55_26695 [Solirubrobacteraceae bacterium]|nr:hypothetical protein [Solirubrobacteraceae bacterium]
MSPRFPQLTGRRAAALAFVVAVALLAALTPLGALMLSPALALVAAIGLGLFPGDELILRVRRRLLRRRAHGLVLRSGRPTPRRRAVPAGLALAFALAMRPPPAAATQLP